MKTRAVDEPRDHLVHVVLRADVLRDQRVEVGRVVRRRLRQHLVVHAPVRGTLQLRDDVPRDGDRVRIVEREVIGDARHARVDVGAAEVLGGHVHSRRGLHQRRPTDEDRPLAFDDHGLVAHGRDVCAAGGGGTHDDGDLRDRERGHPCLVVEDPAEVLAVGEDFVLSREERSARVDEVEAGEPVLEGDLLRAQVLLHRERVIGAALHRRVVRDDHALVPADAADPGDDPRAGGFVVVHAERGEGRELEERRARVEEPLDALAREELPRLRVTFAGALRSAEARCGQPLAKLRDQALHRVAVRACGLVAPHARLQDGHATMLVRAGRDGSPP